MKDSWMYIIGVWWLASIAFVSLLVSEMSTALLLFTITLVVGQGGIFLLALRDFHLSLKLLNKTIKKTKVR